MNCAMTSSSTSLQHPDLEYVDELPAKRLRPASVTEVVNWDLFERKVILIVLPRDNSVGPCDTSTVNVAIKAGYRTENDAVFLTTCRETKCDTMTQSTRIW